MWHPPPQTTSPYSNNDATWEDLLDSGELDHRLSNMTVVQPPPHQIGIHSVAPPPHSHPPPHAVNFNVPPPNMVPGHPMYVQQSQQQTAPLFPHPPPMRMNQNLNSPTGIRHPQLSIMQRPNNVRNNATTPIIQQRPKKQTSNPNLGSQAYPANPKPLTQQIQVISDTEHGRLSQYRPPEPKLTILKRPQSTPSNLSQQGQPRFNQGVTTKSGSLSGPNSTKSLKQREEEYAQARLSILGSATSPDDDEDTNPSDNNDESSEKSADSITNKPNFKLNEDESKRVDVVRTPKGPDGTKGFTSN